MNLLETFSTLDEIYDSYIENNNSLTEGQSMPYALLVKSGNTWSVYKGLHSEPTTEEELAELDMFLKDKPEYSEVKVIPSSDIYKYVKKTNENLKEHYLSRDEIISKLKALGRQYYFNKYTDEQLYCILEKEEKKVQDKLEANQAQAELIKQQLEKEAKPVCDECGYVLTDGGYCPVCDNGEEDLFEGIFDGTSNLNSWVVMPSTNNTPQQTVNASDAQNTSTNNVNSTSGYIVTIMYDGHKLRARADDGVHGRANVAFPTALRNHNGQQYEVENLVWNGKNYRASGKIKPVNSVANTQNINENINKENPEMNFTSVMEELNRLYEADEVVNEENVEPEVEVVPDEVEESTVEYDQLILECSKCGALTIKDKDAVVTNEDTDLVNEEDACAFCEEAAGYKIVGAVAPYVTETDEVVEDEIVEDEIVEESLSTEDKVEKKAENSGDADAELDEGIFDKFKKKPTSAPNKKKTYTGEVPKREVTYTVYDENGTKQFDRTFTELPHKMTAEDQFIYAFKDSYVYNTYRNSTKKRDWQYERVSSPEDVAFDTKHRKGYNHFLAADLHLESIQNPEDNLEEGILDLVKSPISLFTESTKEPHTIRGYEKGNTEFSSTVAQELKSKFNGVIEQVKTDQGVEDLWVDTDGKAKAAERYVAKQYPDSAFSYDEYDMILGKKDLDELFNTKINVDARGFGGSGNDVDII